MAPSIRAQLDAEIEPEEDAIERLRALSSAAMASLGWMSTHPTTRPTPAVLLRERQIIDIELELLKLEIARRAKATAKHQATCELAQRDE